MTINFSRRTELLRNNRVKTRNKMNETRLKQFIVVQNVKQKLNEIKLNVVTLTTRHRARRDMRIFNDEVRDVKFFDDLMSIIDQIKRFLNKKMIFSIHIIFEKRKIVSII